MGSSKHCPICGYSMAKRYALLAWNSPTLLSGIRICGIQDGIMAWPIKYSNGNCKSRFYLSLMKGGIKVSLKEDPRDSFQTLQWQESTFTERKWLERTPFRFAEFIFNFGVTPGSSPGTVGGARNWTNHPHTNQTLHTLTRLKYISCPIPWSFWILPLPGIKPSPRKSEPFINRVGEGDLLLFSAFTKSCLTL